MARIVVGSALAVVVGGACLLSYRAQSAPATESVTTTAVVVSSLACGDGPGGTVVDVLDPAGPLAGDGVRTDLDACGYQEGQQIAVQYDSGDPTQLSLAGTDALDDSVTGDRLLPIGLVVAALLAAAAGIAVWLDTRRPNRHAAGGAAATHTEPEQPAAIETPTGQADDGWPTPSLAALSFGQAGWSAEAAAGENGSTEPGPTEFDLIFPFTSSLADSLHDELFTHRSVYS